MNKIVLLLGCSLALVTWSIDNPSFTPEAVQGYKIKADAGDAEAQYLYSWALANGRGTERNLSQAFIYAQKAADQGYMRAFRRVGMGYERGWNGTTNTIKAASYYAKFIAWATVAAEKGDAVIQRDLGLCYEYGEGVKTNQTEAVKWYRKAADQGDPVAQKCLGWCYESGTGVEIDPAEAVKWYRKSADQGDSKGFYFLGFMLAWGKGCTRDLAQAAECFRKSSEGGDVWGHYALGCCYEWGRGVKKDEKEALRLYQLAVEKGGESILKRLEFSRLWLSTQKKQGKDAGEKTK